MEKYPIKFLGLLDEALAEFEICPREKEQKYEPLTVQGRPLPGVFGMTQVFI